MEILILCRMSSMGHADEKSNDTFEELPTGDLKVADSSVQLEIALQLFIGRKLFSDQSDPVHGDVPCILYSD